MYRKLVLTKGELDPPKIKRDPRYHPNFGIEVHLGDVCEKKCNSRKQSGELCDKCKPLVEGEIKQWKKIHAALQVVYIYIYIYNELFSYIITQGRRRN